MCVCVCLLNETDVHKDRKRIREDLHGPMNSVYGL